MHTIKILFWCVLICAGQLSSAALKTIVEHFPNHTSVVIQFYEQYGAPEDLSEMVKLDFARKPDGWHILLINFENNAIEHDFPFWTSKGYLKQPYFELLNKKTAVENKFTNYQNKDFQLSWHNERMFKVHTFYGYPGWADDIITHLAPKRHTLNDDDLYSLGRAYSAVSGCMTLHNPDASVKYMPNTTSTLALRLSGEPLKNYVTINTLAVECFKELADRNPNFNDIVGKIQTKFANEVVQGYLDLWMYSNQEEQAHQLLSVAQYPEEILANSRNYLKNCSPNSILITLGDNDTYPLWYLQATENYRQDVCVVNYSLLSYAAYVKAWQKGMNGNRLNFQIDLQKYEELDLIYFAAEGSGEGIPPNAFINWINSSTVEASYGSGTLTGTFNHINLSCKTDEKAIYPTAYERLWYKYHLALLDIYISNDRPLEAVGIEDPLSIFGKENFTMRGLVSQLNVGACAQGEIDHEQFLPFVKNIDHRPYKVASNYPKKMDGTFVDDIVVQRLYGRLLEAMANAKQIGDNDLLFEYDQVWKLWNEFWAAPPVKHLSTYYNSYLNN